MLKRLCLCAFVLAALACGENNNTPARNAAPPVPGPQPQSDQGAWAINAAGAPDEDYSSENEVPRPPIVARMMTYKAKHVRVILMPEVPGKPNAMSTPPPYKWWTIVAFSDPGLSAKAGLSRAEGMRRLLGQ
jgi:hypothetical protein